MPRRSLAPGAMMLPLTRVVQTFPSARIPSMSSGVPVEVSLIARLGHGAGNHLFASAASRRRRHTAFVDELHEPSAKLGGTLFSGEIQRPCIVSPWDRRGIIRCMKLMRWLPEMDDFLKNQ